MNREPYGRKCKCGHFESEHVARPDDFSLPYVIPEMGAAFTHPPDLLDFKRKTCKICDCEQYHPQKRW